MHLDWDRGHGPVTGPINAAGAALASAVVGDVTHASPWLPAAVAGAGMLGTHIAGLRRRKPRTTLGLYAAAWVGAGGWCSFAMVEGAWTTTVLGSLMAGAVGLGAALAGAHHHEEKVAAEKEHAAEQARLLSMDGKRRKIAAEWAGRIQRIVTGATVRIVGVELWDSGGGFTLEGDCDGGTKWRDLKPYEDALSADAKLPEGCGVNVGPGAHRGAVLLDVATVNRLIGEDTYPADYSPLTLNGPVPLGLFRDGSVFAPTLRQLTTLLAGRKGSGKTNLSNVFLAGYVRMADNVLWVIDLNGGGLALPWLHAWHKAGKPGRPPVDWVADTPEKALAMARAALAVAKARKPGYKHLEIAANDDKLPVSAKVPGILIAGDEIAELYSPKARRDPILRETGDILVQVVELARAVAVNALITALRATQDVLSEPQILVQSGLKIGMKSDDRELNYLFGWNDRLSPEEAPYPGCGFAKVLDEPAKPFKAFRMLPAQIAEIVTATSGLRPELDELSRRAAGEAYEKRWEDTDHLFGLGPAPEADSVYEAPAAVDFTKPRGSGVTAGWDTPDVPAGVDAQAAIDEAEAVRRKLHEAMNDAALRDPDLEQQFRDMLAGGGIDWQGPAQPDTPRPVPEPTPGVIDDARWPKVFAIVVEAGPGGISPKDTVAAFQIKHPTLPVPSRSAITDWLQKEPKIEQVARGLYVVKEEYR